MAQHGLELATEDGGLAAIGGGIGQVRVAIAVDGHPIAGPGKILGGEPEPDGTVRAVPGQHLDAAQRPPPRTARRVSGPARIIRQVKRIHAQRLLEHCLVRLLPECGHVGDVMAHVVPADLAGSIAQPGRMPGGRRLQQHLGGVDRPGGQHHDVADVLLAGGAAPDDDLGDRLTARIGLQPPHLGVDEHGDVQPAEQRPDRDDVGVGLGVHQARKAIAFAAANAQAGRRVRFVENDAARYVKRVVPGPLQVVGDLLDQRLMRYRRPRIFLRPGTLGRILAMHAAYLVEPFGLGVPGLEFLVSERPGRRHAVHVCDLAEVGRAQAAQGGAVELGGAADVVVHARLERAPGPVAPGILRDVAAGVEHLKWLPVTQFPGQEIPPLEQQDPFSRHGQRPRQRSAAGPASYYDGGVMVRHFVTVACDFPACLTRRG